MNSPDISKDFTIDDIHKIREHNAAERERLGAAEYNRALNKKVAEFLRINPEEILAQKPKKKMSS